MILTNGQTWQVYHLTGGLPIVIDRILDVDLLGEGTVAQKADALFHISRDAIKRRAIDELWREKAATSPKSLAAVVLSESVVDSVRKELRRRTGFNGDPAALAAIIRNDVIHSDLLER
jgi:hypothetical protein